MRLFVSYARVDKPYCIEIVNQLEVHDVWYDQRLYAGQKWWKEILRRLDWCEGFIYLLSPESVASEYCRKEFDLARTLGRHIFPVMIHDDTPLPDALVDVQYIDLSNGLTPDVVRDLLNSIYIAERDEHSTADPATVSSMPSPVVKAPEAPPARVISTAVEVMEKGQFDQAVFLLKQAKANGFNSRFINIDAILREAEAALERQTYFREAEREYKQISELVKYNRTVKLGCEAFRAFQKDFPEYDPACLDQICSELSEADVNPLAAQNIVKTAEKKERADFTLPMLEWCEIPMGIARIQEMDVKESRQQPRPFYVDEFKVSKYPITNAQYDIFLEDPDGYANTAWWRYSPHALEWRNQNPEPKKPSFKGAERPREMVNWYDSMAFCQWLGSKLGMNITLPTQGQWQRAAVGMDNRMYPWGNTFDKNKANTRESQIKMTTIVMRYPEGASPYGVMDMSGNVWEWCLNAKGEYDRCDITSDEKRAVQGGSFVSVYQRAQIPFHYFLNPGTFYGSIGFRIVHVK